MGKIKVLHIIKTFGLGGAEVNLLNLVRCTDKEEFDLHVAYTFGGPLEPQFKAMDIKLFKYADENPKLKSFATIGIILRLAAYIRKNKIRIVHTHSFSAHIWASVAAKFTGAKVIEHVHDFRYFEPQDYVRRRGGITYFDIIYKLKGLSERIVVLTKQNKDFVIGRNIAPASRVRELQNGIPIEPADPVSRQARRTELRQKFGLNAGDLVILTPIRIAPEKNPDLIIRTAAAVVKEVPNAVFLIAGSGPLAEACQKDIDDRNLQGNVKLIGYHSDVAGLLQGADIFLLPSFLELHSIAILEAMSLSVPVVVSEEVGCNSEFIDSGTNGLLLDPFKDSGWAPALVKLLKDPSLRQEIGARGFQTCCERFDIRNVAKTFESLYKEVLCQK